MQFLSPGQIVLRTPRAAHSRLGEPRGRPRPEPRLSPQARPLRAGRRRAAPASPGSFSSASGCSRRSSAERSCSSIRSAQIAEMKDALPGAIDPHSGLPYLFGGDKLARDVFGRVIAGARIVLDHRAARDACWRSRSASRSACRPAISAGGSTRSCRFSPIWCWPSRSSSCSTCWCRRAFWRRRSPIRWRRSSSPFRSCCSACFFVSGYRTQPSAARASGWR